MSKLKDSVIIADNCLTPFYIRFDGVSFHLYETKITMSKDNEEYKRDVPIASFSALEKAADEIVKQRVVKTSRKGLTPSQIKNITLLQFIEAYRQEREEIFKALKLI